MKKCKNHHVKKKISKGNQKAYKDTMKWAGYSRKKSSY